VTRDELVERVLAFTDAFNRDDLEGVMAAFAEDAVYDELHGARHTGKAAIRAAFVPQFRGDFGRLRFDTEDVFVDLESRKAMISWSCRVETAERAGAWRGLDLLWLDAEGRVQHKSTYAKARAPLFDSPAEPRSAPRA
jgi:uncharacterized protein (TIGR02246 family)